MPNTNNKNGIMDMIHRITNLLKGLKDNSESLFPELNKIPKLPVVDQKNRQKHTGETKGQLTLLPTESGVDRWQLTNKEEQPENTKIPQSTFVKEPGRITNTEYLTGRKKTNRLPDQKQSKKEYWEMTPVEYAAHITKELINNKSLKIFPHHELIEKAIYEGNSVPRDIWKMYPDQKIRERLRKVVTYNNPNFLKWFGDWRNDPFGIESSKVLKSEGTPSENEPLSVYHGSTTAGFTNFSEGKSIFCRFGKGFYFAESSELAEEYTKSMDKNYIPEQIPVGFTRQDNYCETIHSLDLETAIDETAKELNNGEYNPYVKCIKDAIKSAKIEGSEEVNISDMFQFFADYSQLYYGGEQSGRRDAKENIILNKFAEKVKKWTNNLEIINSKAGVYEAYLKIKQPFDMSESRLLPSSADAILKRIDIKAKISFTKIISNCRDQEGIVEELNKSGIKIDNNNFQSMEFMALLRIKQVLKTRTDNSIFRQSGDWSISWDEMHYLLSDAGKNKEFVSQFNEGIQKIGYDGICKYERYIPSKPPHRIWIAFKPNQIKSVNNNGDFGTENNNIYKSFLISD